MIPIIYNMTKHNMILFTLHSKNLTHKRQPVSQLQGDLNKENDQSVPKSTSQL